MPRLLDPINIGSLKLRNRIVMPAMATDLSTPNGEVADSQIKHYSQRANRLGLMITEHSYVRFEGRYSRNQMGIHDDKLIDDLSRLTAEVHKKGTPIVAQLSHAGARTTSQVMGSQTVAPSSVCVPDCKETPRELAISELYDLIEAYRQAARRAAESGYDAIEIHGAHGWLLHEFLSPLSNKRTDEYGGCLENRMRFPLAVIEAVRKEVGSKFPLLYRLGADDRMPGGVTPNEGANAAKMLVEAGVDAINVSGGFCGSKPKNMQDQGFYFYAAETIRRAVKIPVIGVGGVKDPKFADEAIRNGRVDLVAVGRAILADPSWAEKAEEVLRPT
jgi:2,4-dienoyl-CoA reductase-like NADH-dependent reductase (Old Yellow Enzyme family)